MNDILITTCSSHWLDTMSMIRLNLKGYVPNGLYIYHDHYGKSISVIVAILLPRHLNFRALKKVNKERQYYIMSR